MPRAGQIIPKYTHPHDEIYINDNTEYTEYTSDSGGVRFLCAFPAKKGRNKLLNFKNLSKWCNEYGAPNYRLHGQATYMPYVLLSTGLAEVQCMRIVAEDSTYANLILCADYKVEAGKLLLKFKMFSRTGLRDLDDLETITNSLETITPDEEGYKRLPVMSFWCLGKGAYGTDFRIRISHDKSADKQNEYKNYNIEVLSTENGSSSIENFNVTFYIDGTDSLSGVSNYVQDVINDIDEDDNGNGSTHIGMEFFYDNYQTLFDKYTEAYNSQGAPKVTIEKVDRLPAITLPASDVIYNLTQTDGSKAAGMYAYNASQGIWAASSYTINTVASLGNATSATTNVIYKLSQADNEKPQGSQWITDGNQWLAAPTIIDVAKLPSIVKYTNGTVYELTDNDGSKLAGTQWIYNDTASDYIAYVAPVVDDVDPIPYTISSWDMFGYNRFTKENDEFMEVVNANEEGLKLFDLEGVGLLNGDDGAMSESQPESVREAAMDAAYIKVFTGESDRYLLSARRTPVDMVLDANMSINVKKQMAAFAVQRADHLLRLDFGLLQTTSDILKMNTSLGTLDSWLISKNAGMMYTNDPITGKKIPVSITLWMANAYPTHVAQFGWYTPFAGERYATLTGYSSPKSVKPVYDEDLDAETLEELYDDHRINYIEAADENTLFRGTQVTSQKKYSDLSRENNVMTTLEIKRRIQRLIYNNRYNWTESADIQNFKEDCEQVFSSYIGTRCKSLSIEVSQTAWEKVRYILHVYLSVVFRTYQERGIVEIDLNPRA